MGKRKKSTRNVGGSKKREPLDTGKCCDTRRGLDQDEKLTLVVTVFKCLFCKHEKAVTCKM